MQTVLAASGVELLRASRNLYVPLSEVEEIDAGSVEQPHGSGGTAARHEMTRRALLAPFAPKRAGSATYVEGRETASSSMPTAFSGHRPTD